MRGVIRQAFCGSVGGLSLFITGCWLGWPSAFLRKLQRGECGFSLTLWQIGWSVALMDLANTVSPIPTGYLMDYYGRKPAFMATAIVFQLSWLMVIFAEGPVLLYFSRIFAGIGKGMGFTILPMYIAEVAEKQIRGALSTLFTLLLFGGTLFEFILGPSVSYMTLNIASTVFPLVFFILCFFLPESPYYLLSVGKKEQAWKSFCFIRKRNKDEPVAGSDPVKEEMDAAEALVKKEMESKTDWMELLRTKGNRRSSLAVFTLAALQRLGGISSLLAYSSTTLPEEGGGFIGGPEQCVIYFGIFLTVGNFLSMSLLDILGRKPLLLVSNVIMAFVLYASGIFYILEATEDFDERPLKWIPYVSILVFAICYSLGIGVVPNTLLGEYFPANVKGKAAAAATIFFALASFSSNKVYPLISGKFGYQAMFLFFGTINAITVLVSILIVYETKNKTFAEIQEMLNS
uniref:Sugar transporter n=1 Tax=Nilaparvata lugens TaxID=108931 RepID=A0A0A8J8L1_NILLU|nr:sugar transporter [Nilaparvata lugens]